MIVRVYEQNGLCSALFMPMQHSAQVDLHEAIAIEDKESILKKIEGRKKGARSSQRVGLSFIVVRDIHAVAGSIAHQIPNRRRPVTGQDEDIANTLRARQLKLMYQQRTPRDIDERLRQISRN